MPMVYDSDGNALGDVPVSAKSQAILDAGEAVSILYHTPKASQAHIGKRSGSFSVEIKDGRLQTDDPDSVREFFAIQRGHEACQAP